MPATKKRDRIREGKRRFVESLEKPPPKTDVQEERELRAQPRTQQTTRGKRRLTYKQAYSRRSTDTSRARVMKLYGRAKPPKDFRGEAHRPTPVPADQVGRPKPPTSSGQSRDLQDTIRRVADQRNRAAKMPQARPPRVPRTGGAEGPPARFLGRRKRKGY